MTIRPLLIAGILAVMITTACTSTRPIDTPLQSTITTQSLNSHLHTLQSITPHLEDLDAEFAQLPLPSVTGRD